MPRERRRSFRVEWTSPASIELEDGQRLNCIVQNLSNGGARLACADEVPDEFYLRLTPGSSRPRTCRVVWRRGHEVGAQFIDELAEKLNPALAPETETIS